MWNPIKIMHNKKIIINVKIKMFEMQKFSIYFPEVNFTLFSRYSFKSKYVENKDNVG